MFARLFAKAAQLLANVPPPEGDNYDIPFLDGIVARAQGDGERERSSFFFSRSYPFGSKITRTAESLSAAEQSCSDGCWTWPQRGRLARRPTGCSACSRVPRCGGWTSIYTTTLAKVYVWSGEHDAALGQLAAIVKLPQGPSYGELRFDPAWDEIRDRAAIRKDYVSGS